MSREQFILAIAIILMAAFLIGWLAHWMVHRFTRVGSADLNNIERMAQELHDAEELRDQALIHIEQREQELMKQIAQMEAELNATMEGLRSARHEAEELRTHLNQGRAS